MQPTGAAVAFCGRGLAVLWAGDRGGGDVPVHDFVRGEAVVVVLRCAEAGRMVVVFQAQ